MQKPEWRDVYISDEATFYLKEFIKWKYREKSKEYHKTLVRNEEDLVFAIYNTKKSFCIISKHNNGI
jgi:hypothetical protein